MQSFQITTAPPAGQKNYVFVDEHNRHKRLKVMRACEGCRRRKIKCDSATTNTWPCTACQRLKLHCVPPATGTEGEFLDENGQTVDFDTPAESTEPVISSKNQSSSFTSFHVSEPGQTYKSYQPLPTYLQPNTDYQKNEFSHIENYDQTYSHGYGISMAKDGVFNDSQTYTANAAARIPSIDSNSPSQLEHLTAEELSEHLGDLKIGEAGIAPYLRQQNKYNAEPGAPIQDIEPKLPSISTGAGSQIRIPPALMPSDEEAVHYFQIFFKDVHPYVPVINRNYFYHQWHSNRSAISPLILEAIFACAGRFSDDPAGGAQWLALANKHEECFLDTPRLSTLQALLLLLKARESAPKRGYYYRSWMTIKTTVSMAKDLELHEHYEIHQNAEACGSDPVECLTKTRIWQTLLVCEMMVGAPQGRSDMGVDPKSVDISTNPPCSDIDEFEKSISRQFAYFVRNARNIRLIGDCYHKLKKKKDWGLDPEFVAYNVTFNNWPGELPADLQISLPPDGSAPSLTSHFMGNLHAHYQLGVVMLHRPQLLASKSFATDDAWKQEMSTCYNSSKLMCRLQEAILNKFGLTGLLCMQRGINFTIYAILTCTMVHLIGITSPDPEFNCDAREYFTRHMRILEQCVSAWTMPETEAQINGLRQAFSADINKPFELKLSFPYGSPSSDQYRTSPPVEMPSSQSTLRADSAYGQPQHPQQRQLSNASLISNTSYMTPPVSAIDSKPDSPQFGYIPQPPTYAHVSSNAYPQPGVMLDTVQWNPTPIIDQFNTAFAIPPAALAPPPPPQSAGNYQLHSPGHDFQQHPYGPNPYSPAYTSPTTYPQQYMHQQQVLTPTSTGTPLPQQPSPLQQIPYSQHQNQTTYMTPGPVYVSARDWQQSVASVLDPGGLKRRWNYDAANIDEQLHKRMK